MISVIILTYNREQYVRNMIEDILKQTYKGFEYIIIDNGSTDRSGEIADIYASKDQRIHVVHLKDAKSIGCARNIGLRESKGEYVAFVDGDDFVDKNYLLNLYNRTIKGKNIYIFISICGIFWEVITPLLKKDSVSDILDFVMYILGASIYMILLRGWKNGKKG